MMNDAMTDALNGQVNAEIYSSYLYLSMSAYFENTSLPGFANWMRVQAQEELAHGMKIFDFINERGGRAELRTVDAPPKAWESPEAAFANVVEHELKVTSLINGLVDLAIEHRDHATNNFLQWFVGEQVEEEASANDTLQKVRRAGDGGGLYILDTELAARIFTPPATKE